MSGGATDRRPAFRPFRPGDRDGCLALFDANVPAFFRPDERDAYAAWLDDPGGPVLVLEEGGRVVAAGGLASEADGETASLCWGIVHPGCQGRGVGRALLVARLARAASDEACRRVRLSTIPATEGFFRKLGFTVAAVTSDGHGPGAAAVEMELDLTPPTRRTLLEEA